MSQFRIPPCVLLLVYIMIFRRGIGQNFNDGKMIDSLRYTNSSQQQLYFKNSTTKHTIYSAEYLVSILESRVFVSCCEMFPWYSRINNTAPNHEIRMRKVRDLDPSPNTPIRKHWISYSAELFCTAYNASNLFPSDIGIDFASNCKLNVTLQNKVTNEGIGPLQNKLCRILLIGRHGGAFSGSNRGSWAYTFDG